MSDREIIIQMGDQEITRLSGWVFRPYNKIFICPNCFKSIHLGKYSPDDKWSYEDEDTIRCRHTLNYKTVKGFLNHVNRCETTLNQGINRIDLRSPRINHFIVHQLANWAKKETRWDIQQVIEGDFRDDKVVAYIFKNQVGPIGYIAFRAKEFGLENIEGWRFILWDLFVFPPFRKQGIATNLLNHGIQDLGIDASLLPVSFPYRDKAKNIIKDASTDTIVACYGTQCEFIKKEEL